MVTSDLKRNNIVHMPKKQATTRIIGGSLRGSKLPFKENRSIRPTEGKTKETLFNWLLNDLEGKTCLDMFAGTGSLGIEALSRGAKEVVFVEKQKKLADSLKTNLKRLQVYSSSQVLNANAFSIDFDNLPYKFDILFIDPPFRENLIQRSLDFVKSSNLLTPKALIYLECETELELVELTRDLNLLKESKGGQTQYCLYET
jgi:16S rRNA (guanine966-N2)-methyltransferase|tara:strand:+ start:191 stop:793 length:603 start_codon:yes stop_codon:yes gene_type:complete